MNILVIEDNRDLLDLLQELLAGKGHAVTCKYSYVDALHYIRDEEHAQAHVVLVDFMLKGASSEALIDLVREKMPAAYVVVMSAGFAEKAETFENLCLQKKIDAMIAKPFEFKALLNLIERFGASPRPGC